MSRSRGTGSGSWRWRPWSRSCGSSWTRLFGPRRGTRGTRRCRRALMTCRGAGRRPGRSGARPSGQSASGAGGSSPGRRARRCAGRSRTRSSVTSRRVPAGAAWTWPARLTWALPGPISSRTAGDREPLELEFRRAVTVGLAAVPRVAGPRNTVKQKPGREMLELCRDRNDDVLRFTTNTSVWPASNISERGVRPLETQQKISGRLTSDDVTQTGSTSAATSTPPASTARTPTTCCTSSCSEIPGCPPPSRSSRDTANGKAPPVTLRLPVLQSRLVTVAASQCRQGRTLTAWCDRGTTNGR